MASNLAPNGPSSSAPGVGDLIHRITDDVRTIATDEIELVKLEVVSTVKKVAAEAAGVMLGGTVALIGFGLLCVTAVVAAEPLIAALWVRLLIMAVIYLAAGGFLAGMFAKRLSVEAVPDLTTPVVKAKRTVENIKHGIKD